MKMAYFTPGILMQLFSTWEKINLRITQALMATHCFPITIIQFSKLLISNKAVVVSKVSLLLHSLLQIPQMQSIIWNLLHLGTDILKLLAF